MQASGSRSGSRAADRVTLEFRVGSVQMFDFRSAKAGFSGDFCGANVDRFGQLERSLMSQRSCETRAGLGSLRRRVRESLDRTRQELLAERVPDGHWVGELAPSALSTATAVSALAAVVLHGSDADANADDQTEFISRGIGYLRDAQNADGGFGDTDRSHSNVATSYLALAASALSVRAVGEGLGDEATERLRGYLKRSGETDALRRRYGTDKTFVVPIMTNLAIAGLVDWDQVPRLPFEAAVFPQSMYRMLRMPVVSYAIPALVAIGQARHFLGRPAIGPLRWVRQAAVGRTMRVLRRMQPESGGYLEATPLTSFVVMSLAVTGRGDVEVAREGVRFLADSVGADGSWPIDTNLATWVTSLAIEALAADPDDDGGWCSESLARWHLGCQHRSRHPFTGADPGGWGWTDLSGAVPDGDDTPAAILALRHVRPLVEPSTQESIDRAVSDGVAWLLKLQNRDGGWPTFCRGWGKLPFDRSSNDLTAHAIRALETSAGSVERPSPTVRGRVRRAVGKGVRFLRRQQLSGEAGAGSSEDAGAWMPLWFGNQDRDDESNPVYGAARVLLAGRGCLGDESVRRGIAYLVHSQNEDGGWGGGGSVAPWMRDGDVRRSAQETREPVSESFDASSTRASELTSAASGQSNTVGVTSTVEETALAIEALVANRPRRRDVRDASITGQSPRTGGDDEGVTEALPGPADIFFPESEPNVPLSVPDGGNASQEVAIIRGIEFLLRAVEEGRHRVPWPIGFYFAKLWYHERLYPLIFTVGALGRYLNTGNSTIETDR